MLDTVHGLAGGFGAAFDQRLDLGDTAGELGSLPGDFHQWLAIHFDGLGQVVDLLILALQGQHQLLRIA